jgi:alpha-tubulin suppressor-like RCC1 family protein
VLATLAALSAAACGELPPLSPEPGAADVHETTSELVAAPGNSIAAGWSHSCVMLEGGAVKCWGYNASGQLGLGDTVNRGSVGGQMANALPAVPLGKGLAAKALASGSFHVCALLSNNQVKCWGNNSAGQLGQGDNAVRGGSPGQMGDNLAPVDLGTGRTAKAIAAGGSFACAILDTNQVKCWGANNRGQLGIGDTANRGDQPEELGDALPTVYLGAGRTALSIAVGTTFACALLDDKTVKCWGDNTTGQLGRGNTMSAGDTQDSMTNLQPINLGMGLLVKTIAARAQTACALIEGVNQIKCWGYNGGANLGVGDLSHRGDGPGEMGDMLPYVNLGSGTTAKDVTLGVYHTCAILDTPNPPPGEVNTNQLKCWGNNLSGSLGLGDTSPRGDASNEMGDFLPLVPVGQGRSVRAVSGGEQHMCAVLDTNQVKCWGDAQLGQLGLGDTNDRGDASNEMGLQLPIVQMGTRGVVMAAVGLQFACVRLANGQLKCWGLNNSGQLGQGDMLIRGDSPTNMGDALLPVDLGPGRTIYNPGTAVPAAGSVIAAGERHVCAVLDNRSVKCWGSSAFGVGGQGDTLTRGEGPNEMGDFLPVVNLGTGKLATQVTAGSEHACARLSTNQVKCWGANANGQLGLGDTQHRGDNANEMGDILLPVNLGMGKTATQLVAGKLFTCALVTGSLVKCWGDSSGAVMATSGIIGDVPTEMGDALNPIPLGSGLTAKGIAAGAQHACAWLSNNQVKCWGDNTFGQLGQGDTTSRRTVGTLGDNLPVVSLGTGRTAKAVFAARNITCALLDTNQLKCWGENALGQLGIGDARNRGDALAEMGDYLPSLQLGAGRTVTALFGGANGSSPCATLENKQIKCWGSNNIGQLGIGNTVFHGRAPGEMGDALPPVDLGAEF